MNTHLPHPSDQWDCQVSCKCDCGKIPLYHLAGISLTVWNLNVSDHKIELSFKMSLNLINLNNMEDIKTNLYSVNRACNVDIQQS